MSNIQDLVQTIANRWVNVFIKGDYTSSGSISKITTLEEPKNAIQLDKFGEKDSVLEFWKIVSFSFNSDNKKRIEQVSDYLPPQAEGAARDLSENISNKIWNHLCKLNLVNRQVTKEDIVNKNNNFFFSIDLEDSFLMNDFLVINDFDTSRMSTFNNEHGNFGFMFPKEAIKLCAPVCSERIYEGYTERIVRNINGINLSFAYRDNFNGREEELGRTDLSVSILYGIEIDEEKITKITYEQ